MQKMQAAAGGKPLGPNGQPSPAQIEAMRVSRFVYLIHRTSSDPTVHLLATSPCTYHSSTIIYPWNYRDHEQKAMPPEMMRKLRSAGPQGAQKMIQDMMGGMGGGTPGAGGPGGPGGMDFGSMMKNMMGGGGGAGGMPDISKMQEMMGQMGMGGAGGGGGMPGESASYHRTKQYKQ